VVEDRTLTVEGCLNSPKPRDSIWRMSESAAELAYAEAVRGLDGQAVDLENIRSHVNVAVSAGGLAAAVLATQSSAEGWAFWIGIAAFVLLIVCAVTVFRPVQPFRYSAFEDVDARRGGGSEGTGLSARVEADPRLTREELVLEVATKAEAGFWRNKQQLDCRWTCHNVALVALVAEVSAFLVHAAVD